MPYTAFHEKFPEIAEKENRKATSIKSDKRVKIGRNDPCPCGSGKKYKNCCMKKKVLPKKNYTST